jgi:hypothetical protein
MSVKIIRTKSKEGCARQVVGCCAGCWGFLQWADHGSKMANLSLAAGVSSGAHEEDLEGLPTTISPKRILVLRCGISLGSDPPTAMVKP